MKTSRDFDLDTLVINEANPCNFLLHYSFKTKNNKLVYHELVSDVNKDQEESG